MHLLRSVILVLIFVPFFGGSAQVYADDNPSPARYMGAHIGGGILGGTGLLSYGGYDEDVPSWTAGGFARVSSVLQLLDMQLEYRYRRLALVVKQAKTTFRGHSVVYSANIHPFFFNILRNNRWWYIASGFYIQAGGGVERMAIRSSPLQVDRVEWAPLFHGGVGLDIPLDNPNDGGGLWLGLNYRYQGVLLDVDLGRGSDVDGHLFLMSLGYRSNDLNFTRLKRPPELEFH